MAPIDGPPEHVVGRVVDADEEGHLDVRPDVVLADQPFRALAEDFDSAQGDVHDLGLADQGQDDGAGEMHGGLRAAGKDQGGALFDFPVAAENHDNDANADHDDRQNDE